MEEYKVFIPCAGKGTRMGEQTEYLNKTLLSVGNKPVISHIVENFEDDIEIVIALGYKGDYIKQFLNLAYPEKIFTFVEIENYEGDGSGLGHTLLCCKEHLQCSFIFMSNDTLIKDEIPTPKKMASLGNWMGYSLIPGGSKYRTVSLNKFGEVVSLNEKMVSSGDYSYVGICGIHDHDDFWKIMEAFEDKGSIEIGESFAISKMLEYIPFKAIKFQWYDAGNVDSFTEAKKEFKKPDDPNILEKPKESIWFVKDRVIKFHIDENFIKDRIDRSKDLYPYVPQVIDNTSNMYSYKYIEGKVMSYSTSIEAFGFFLDWMYDFWERKELGENELNNFRSLCFDFYYKKTVSRINEYFERFNNKDSEREIINGVSIPSIEEMLDDIDWNWISDGVPVKFHGDLHFENIVVASCTIENQLPFSLLDWRQNFAGFKDYGDVYYDLAKLMHGLIISHGIISDNLYSYERKMNSIRFDFLRKNMNIECENLFESYIEDWGFDLKKVKVLAALIFLNIAGLHHYPYCHLLFYLGKMMLFNLTWE